MADYREERWLPIPGWEDLYMVSDHGRVKSLDRTTSHGRRRKGKVLKLGKNRGGYFLVGLYRDGKRRTCRVHRLVVAAFIGEIPKGMEVAHWDNDPANNQVSNLRIATPKENQADRIRHGTSQRHLVERGEHNNTIKTHCPNDHPLSGDNLVPSSLKQGRRECRACSRARGHVWRNELDKSEYPRHSHRYFIKGNAKVPSIMSFVAEEVEASAEQESSLLEFAASLI